MHTEYTKDEVIVILLIIILAMLVWHVTMSTNNFTTLGLKSDSAAWTDYLPRARQIWKATNLPHYRTSKNIAHTQPQYLQTLNLSQAEINAVAAMYQLKEFGNGNTHPANPSDLAKQLLAKVAS